MKELIEQIEGEIQRNNTLLLKARVDNPTELKAYSVGLADALEMVKEYEELRLKVGKKYFVIYYNKHSGAIPYEMTLNKISETINGVNYCFARNPPSEPDEVLWMIN